MPLRIDDNLSPVPYTQRVLTTVVQPSARTKPFKSQMMPYRSQSLPPTFHNNRKSNPEEGQTYTVHRDMSGLKSDLLGHIVDLYA
jgi:hypothetical protein